MMRDSTAQSKPTPQPNRIQDIIDELLLEFLYELDEVPSSEHDNFARSDVVEAKTNALVAIKQYLSEVIGQDEGYDEQGQSLGRSEDAETRNEFRQELRDKLGIT